MEGIPATYLGKIVSKQNFRAFIYGPNESKKLVNSWDEYEAHMSSGMWFATRDEVMSLAVEKLKRLKKGAVKAVAINKDDGFLPKE